MTESRFPSEKVNRMNWMLIMFISAFNFLFLFIFREDFHNALVFTLMGAFLMFIMANLNMVLSVHVKDPIKRYMLSYVLGIGTYFLIWPLFAHFNGLNWSFDNGRLMVIFVVSSFLLNTLILGMQNRVVVQHQKDHAELENYQLKTANAEASNLLLKQQIHPHFLFNSLNSLKALYRKDTTQGEQYLMLLADFLRSAVSASHLKLSPLAEELELSQNYLAMQQIRFGSALQCSIEGLDQVKGFVPAFSIQPLLENAIKHNELTEHDPLHIQICITQFWVKVSNNIKLKTNKETSSGSGLANLAERYRLCCDEDIKISIEDSAFTVEIKILTNGDHHH